jgi:endonuclease/exonuclease/phosphatase family metal-dependent hydrolase
MLWFGNNPRHGIAVIAADGYSISPLPTRDAPPYAFPVQVNGPTSFLLLAIWSQRNRDFRYVRAVIQAVEIYRDLIMSQPTVVAGDFNSNTIWDYKRPPTHNHSGLVQQLGALGLISAYHHFFDEAQGAESRPTLYLLRDPAKRYHIDYCFIPRTWASGLRSVDVGADESWAAHSDHRPLIVDIDLAGDPLPLTSSKS